MAGSKLFAPLSKILVESDLLQTGVKHLAVGSVEGVHRRLELTRECRQLMMPVRLLRFERFFRTIEESLHRGSGELICLVHETEEMRRVMGRKRRLD